MYKYTRIQRPRFQKNYIIARDQKSDLHGTSFQSSPKINRMLITRPFAYNESLQHPTIAQAHPTSIFGKYLFGIRFEILNFRNICCKISSLPASPRIFEHLKNGIIAHFKRIFTLKSSPRISGAFFLAEIFEKVSFHPYNFRITRLSARKSEQMKNF